MGIELAALSDERLGEMLIGAEPLERANAWARLVPAVGREEASRRWLAVFAAFDAAET